MDNQPSYIGYVKYHGEKITDGIMGAREAAKALLGFDKAIRHFTGKQNKSVQKLNYEIPVVVQKGSWQAYIPDSIETIIKIGATVYLSTAATKMASNDFKNIGFKKIFIKALQSIQWFIKIAKHIGSTEQRPSKGIKWRHGNTEVGIPNESGEYLWVPKVLLDLYITAPPSLLSDLASLVEPGRELRISVQHEEGEDIEDLLIGHKSIFYMADEDGEILCPELAHGVRVNLEGLVTRGNENTNSIGFYYKNHILNCYPQDGSIVRFKYALFLNCKITGIINREDSYGNPTKKKPEIIFENIEPLEGEPSQLSLLDELK